MDPNTQYDDYSLSELKEARSTIDADRYPEKAAALDKRIAMFAERENSPNSTGLLAEDKPLAAVKFHGKTGEYFSIWIVNLLLSIVTLGIFSAWAKVRTYRYFYGNTDIGGHRLTYLATPLQILKGRILAVCLFACYFILSSIHPMAGVALALLLAVFTPVLVVLSYRFKLRMTAYRHVRFHFNGSIKQAFVVFLLLPIVSVFTLYTILPIVFQKIDEYLIDGSGYGDRQFSSRLSTAEYYGTSLLALCIAMGIFMMGGICLAVAAFLAADGGSEQGMISLLTVGFFGLYGLAYIFASGFYSARIRNHIFSRTNLTNVAQFSSKVRVWPLIWLRFSNIIAIICSLGFAIPWVQIRTAHFYANTTYIAILPGIDAVVADERNAAGALGEEAATLFDVDVALG